MYNIITNNSDVIANINNECNILPNGDTLVIGINTIFPKKIFNTYLDVSNVPYDIMDGKYCYTLEQGFYINPDWVEPDPTNTYDIPAEIYHAIIDDYTAELFGGEE